MRPTPSSGGHPRNAPAHHIVLWDFGAKANIQRELENRGCNVTVVPCTTTADEILALKPDGLMLSNGPGDPAENVEIIEEIRKLCEYNKKTLKQVQGDSLFNASDQDSGFWQG